MKIYFKNSLIPLLAGSIGLSPFLSIQAETAFDVTWTKLLGTSAGESSGGVATASDGSIFITGSTTGDLDGETNAGSNDAFLTKYGSDGTKAWTKLLGTSSSDYGLGVATASDGSIYITGYTNGDLDGETNAGSTDAFLTKYDSDGTKAWTKLLGSSSSDISRGVAIASDGSIFITGSTTGDLDGETNAGSNDAFLTKYGSDGTKAWTKLLGTSASERSRGVATASDGSIFITGFTLGDLDGETNAGNYEAFLTKYGSDGTKAWTKLLGTSIFEESYGVATASDGSIYITGYTNGDLDGETNAGSTDAFLTKYDSDGTKAWTKLLGTSSAEESYGVATASDGSIFITGYTFGDLDGETNAGSLDIFVSKYSSDGTKAWTKLLGTSSSDYGLGVATASDGSIYITGYTNGDLDGETNAGSADAFLIKLAEAFAASSTSTTLHTEWVQPYAAMQSVGLGSIKNNRDLVLAKAGECNNSGWVIENTDYCIYTNANNTIASVNGNSSYGSYDYANFNTSINVEKTINDKWKAGIAYGVGSSNLDNYNFSSTTASLSSTNTHYSIYGVKKVSDKFTLKGMIGGSDFDYKGNRNYSTTSATSTYDTDGYTAEINGIWDIKKTIKNMKTPIRLKPSVGVAYAAHTQDGFSESGSGDLITLEANQAESLLLKTGISVDKQILMEGGKWLLVPSIALNYEMDTYADDNHRGLKGGVTGSSDATTLVSAKTFGQHNGSVKVGADFVLTKDFMFNLNAEYGLAEGGDEQSYGGGFRWQF